MWKIKKLYLKKKEKKIRVENFHLLIYVNYKIYAKAMLCKFLS